MFLGQTFSEPVYIYISTLTFVSGVVTVGSSKEACRAMVMSCPVEVASWIASPTTKICLKVTVILRRN